MKKGLPGDRLRLVVWELSRGGPSSMLYAGLDLSRKRLDFHLLDAEGATVEVGAAPPDADGLRGLSERLDRHGAADPRGDRVDERRALRARPARACRLAGRDRRRAEGEGAGAAGLQDRPDRRLGAGRARPPRPGAGDLAARPARARRARAGALAAAPRPPPLEPEAARARRPAHARQALPGLRPVRRARPPAARPARPAGAVAGHDRGEPAPDRRARPRDRRVRSASCAGSAPTTATCRCC